MCACSRFLESNGTAYLVMDYEDGESLAEHLQKCGVLSEAEILDIMLPVLEGLGAVHAKDFLHRDIKPGNIYLRKNGPPVLLDFGAARQALGEQTRALTGMVTPGYAPFEQYNSRSKQGPWTDLYSIGATMYHCLAGKPPAESPDRIAALQEQEADPMPPAVVAGQGRYRPEFLAVVDAMLAPLPKDRPQHIEQVLERLRALGKTAPPAPTRDNAFPTTQVVGAPEVASAPPSQPVQSTRDEIETFKAMRRRAEAGEAEGQFRLGVMYAYGRGTARDEAEAASWLRKAAGQNHIAAQMRLGLMLARGAGVAKDEAEAAEWLRKAAERNDSVAQFNLGLDARARPRCRERPQRGAALVPQGRRPRTPRCAREPERAGTWRPGPALAVVGRCQPVCAGCRGDSPAALTTTSVVLLCRRPNGV